MKIEYSELKKQTGIYAIINKVNGKCYIGSCAHKFETRLSKHLSDLRKIRHHSTALQNAYNKYGENNFEFKILELVPKSEFLDNKYLTDVEQLYLDTFKCEYNVCKKADSSLGVRRSEQWFIKQKNRVRPPVSKETGEKIRQAHKGKPVTSKITKNQAIEILYSKESRTKLAQKYNIDKKQIRRIQLGTRWVTLWEDHSEQIINNRNLSKHHWIWGT